MRESVKWFAEQMENKLSENDHKNHWSNSPSIYLLRRLREEKEELLDAIIEYELACNKGETQEIINKLKENIIKESADVSNFSMMIADNYSERKTKEVVRN